MLASIAILFALVYSIVTAIGQNDGNPIVVHGDSTAVGSRIPLSEKFWNVLPSLDGTRWWVRLGKSYSPTRPVLNDARKGQTIHTMRLRMEADRSNSDKVTVIYDRINTEEDLHEYLIDLDAAIRTLTTTKFLIMPQIPSDLDNTDVRSTMAEIDAFASARWPRNTLSTREREKLQADLKSPDTRADGIHRNAHGQKIEFLAVKHWLDEHGW